MQVNNINFHCIIVKYSLNNCSLHCNQPFTPALFYLSYSSFFIPPYVHVSRQLSLILFLCISWGSAQSIWNFPFIPSLSLVPCFPPLSIHGSGSAIPALPSPISIATLHNAWCSPCWCSMSFIHE